MQIFQQSLSFLQLIEKQFQDDYISSTYEADSLCALKSLVLNSIDSKAKTTESVTTYEEFKIKFVHLQKLIPNLLEATRIELELIYLTEQLTSIKRIGIDMNTMTDEMKNVRKELNDLISNVLLASEDNEYFSDLTPIHPKTFKYLIAILLESNKVYENYVSSMSLSAEYLLSFNQQSISTLRKKVNYNDNF
jgi:hypothetical protein